VRCAVRATATMFRRGISHGGRHDEGTPDADRARVVHVALADSGETAPVGGGTSLSAASMRAEGERRVTPGDHPRNAP
jgi:hypothetical protein